MLNNAIIILLIILFALSIVTAVTESVYPINSEKGRFFRAIRIRLREISLTSFCVTSIILLLLGLIFGDDNFTGIFIAIVLIFGILCVLLPGDIIGVYKSRKKARLKTQLLGLQSETALNTRFSALAKELSPLPEGEKEE